MQFKIAIIAIAIFFSGCAVKDRVKQAGEQLDYLETSNKRVEDKISKLDSLSKVEMDIILSMKAGTAVRLNEIENRIEAMENRVGDLEILLQRKTGSRVVKTGSTGKHIPADVYNIAYSDFTKGNYDLAVAGFRKFLCDIPDADNALYWIGECYYAKESHIDALKVFKSVAENYPTNKKAPTSLHKVATIYKALEDTLMMKKYLRKVIKIYPDSPEAKLAKESLSPQDSLSQEKE